MQRSSYRNLLVLNKQALAHGRKWLPGKYGADRNIVPWQIDIKFRNKANTADGTLPADSEYRKIKYRYVARN